MEAVRKWLAELMDNNPAEKLQISLSPLAEKLCPSGSAREKNHSEN